MNIFPVGGVGSIGMVADKKPHELPFQAWSDARNVRFLDAFVEKFLGETSYTTPNIAPYFLLPVPTVTNIFWLLAGLAKTHCFDGTAHTDITRTVGGDYAATEDLNWTGSVFNGIPLINNSVDAPQMWSPVAASQALQALSNWPANTTCRTLRAFRNFLIAGDITKSGTRYKQMVKWSHPAGVGALPSSWDETDATKDAGEWPLAETPGAILDFVPLRDLNIVYKEDAVYKMQWVGGVYVFSFRELTTEIGLLSRRCAVGFKPGFQAFLGQGDIHRHDGQQTVSILDGRMRRWLVNNIDSTYYKRSFAVAYAKKPEVWFCFPASGNSLPTLAIVWNWQDDTITVRELGDVAHISAGNLVATSELWSGDSRTWAGDTEEWDVSTYNPATKDLVLAKPGTPVLTVGEQTNQVVGASMTAYVERTGLGIPFKVSAPPDFTSMKFFSELWPRIEGTAGGVVQITVGVQDSVDGAVSWRAPQSYVIGTTEKVEADIAGRLLAVRFESTTDVEWRLHGYDIIGRLDGDY
ncbi:hypothetical protein FJY94_07490 [Candidatus Kaiserbacteria bacterium]|nr:hypothetical protein [Candidatus Kaiserbacteria bacterium]